MTEYSQGLFYTCTIRVKYVDITFLEVSNILEMQILQNIELNFAI